jgi:hypothetical protein
MDAYQERTLRAVEGLAGVEPWEVSAWLVRLIDQAEFPEAAPRAVWEAECERRRGSVQVSIDA